LDAVGSFLPREGRRKLIAYETMLMEIVSLPCRENGKLVTGLPFFTETRPWLFDCRSHSGVDCVEISLE
jgi:hypothetical protein